MDISGLLTLIGIFVAMWTLMPKESKDNFILKLSPIDWIVISTSVISINFIIFYPVIKSVGLSYEWMYWRWGFDEETSTYLISLLLTVYLFRRYKTSKLPMRKLNKLLDLMDSLFNQRKYTELTYLINQNSEILFGSRLSLRNRISDSMLVYDDFESVYLHVKKSGRVKLFFKRPLGMISQLICKRNDNEQVKTQAFHRVFSSVDYVSYLVQSNPYLSLKLTSTIKSNIIKSTLVENIFIGMLNNTNSLLYFELDAHYNNSHKGKFLNYFICDIEKAKNLEIYRYIGEHTKEIISLPHIVSEYNTSRTVYTQKSFSKCPIYAGVSLFYLIVIESISKNINWHMWLYYYSSFSQRIIKELEPDEGLDLNVEFPTSFHFILYAMIDNCFDWLRVAINDNKVKVLKSNNLQQENGNIVKCTILLLGELVSSLIMSDTVGSSFKSGVIERYLDFVNNLKENQEGKYIPKLLIESLILKGRFNRYDESYSRKLSLFLGMYKGNFDIDEVLDESDNLKELNKALNTYSL